MSSLSLHARQSGGTCDTQKELFDFIKEERECSRILRRENLTLAGENIDLREKVLSQQQQIESLTLANKLLQQDEISDFKKDNDIQLGWHVQRNRHNGGPMRFATPPSADIHTPLFNRFSIPNQQPVETEIMEKSHRKDPGDKLPDKELRKAPANERKQNNKFGKESNLKPKVIIAGDSIVKNVQGWRLSSKKDVKVHSFSGAKIADMNHHIVPLLERKPDEVSLHIGANDIEDSEEENAQIADELIKLTRKVMNANITCTVSLLTRRDDRFKTQVDRVNDIIRDKLKDITNIKVIDNEQIKHSDLNRRGLHLSKSGTAKLAKNFIKHINHNH